MASCVEKWNLMTGDCCSLSFTSVPQFLKEFLKTLPTIIRASPLQSLHKSNLYWAVLSTFWPHLILLFSEIRSKIFLSTFPR
jgi:hypothetical protein